MRALFTHGIWNGAALIDRSVRGKSFAALRVVSMTWHGIRDNNLASRAGSLSYSSMLGLAPLVAIIVMFSSIVLERTDPDFAANQLNNAISFVVPQLEQLQAPRPGGETEAPAPDAEAAGAPLTVNPQLVAFLNDIIAASQSKAIGIVGAIVLIVIVIQLFSSIENAFNGIWGVRRGRNWLLRIVFYWTAVTLGAVLAFTAITILSASTFVSVIESLPLGPELRKLFSIFGPLISGVILAGLLTCFYKFIPNTSVGWFPSAIGGVTVVFLLYLNNYLAFLYLNTVVRQQSLFGSFALPIILMLGLYVFWLFVLLGGQVTYAVQNANYRSSSMAWHGLHHTARQGLALLVLTIIARRFRACDPAYSAPEIAELIKIPTQILNACLGRLMQLGLVSRIPPEDGRSVQEDRFQPARPLDRITLPEFKELFDGLGDGPTREMLDAIDPVVKRYHERLRIAISSALGSESLDEIIDQLPILEVADLETTSNEQAAFAR